MFFLADNGNHNDLISRNGEPVAEDSRFFASPCQTTQVVCIKDKHSSATTGRSAWRLCLLSAAERL